MLETHRLRLSLQHKAHEFRAYQHQDAVNRRRYQGWLQILQTMPAAAIFDKLSPHLDPGARPTDEIHAYPSLCVPFAQTFQNHQDARAWAASVLTGFPTLAVDGSQLMPSKELSIPVSVVQASWFFNPHHPSIPFEKNLATEVIGPQELLTSGSPDKQIHEQFISLRRYEIEIHTLLRQMQAKASLTPRFLAFFDGSLLVSFAEIMFPLYRQRYLQAAIDLLDTSHRLRLPLLGYVDTSIARDLLRMFALVIGEDTPSAEDARDTKVFEDALPAWGDRSIAFALARPGIQRSYAHAGEGIGFLYLRTSREQPPVRVEFPLWLYNAGLLDTALDVLRSEIIIGNGYPYALETADQIAWFSPHDRSSFQDILLRFLQDEEIPFLISNKQQSKERRRDPAP